MCDLLGPHDHAYAAHQRHPLLDAERGGSASELTRAQVDGSGKPNPKDASTQIKPTLGPKVYKYHLLWLVWIPRAKDMDLL